MEKSTKLPQKTIIGECELSSQSTIHPVDTHVGKRLKTLRKSLNITQKKLASLVDLTFPQVQKYENGTNRISASKLFDLAKALDTSVTYFFEGLSKKWQSDDVSLYNDNAVNEVADDTTKTLYSASVPTRYAVQEERAPYTTSSSSLPSENVIPKPRPLTPEESTLLNLYGKIADPQLKNQLLRMAKVLGGE